MRNYGLILLAGLLLVAGCATLREDYTSGESEVCKVHSLRMSKTVVPIKYGLIQPSERSLARFAASTNSFPNADDWVWGGCCVDSARQAVIYTCLECKRLRARWEADYDEAVPTQNPLAETVRSGWVFVSGEVQTPGRCAWTNGLTLSVVIQAAGGFTAHAKSATVRIRHATGVVEKVNCTGGLTNSWTSIKLAPDDRVSVPRKAW
jgi:hypothetical protein